MSEGAWLLVLEAADCGVGGCCGLGKLVLLVRGLPQPTQGDGTSDVQMSSERRRLAIYWFLVGSLSEISARC